MTNTPAYPPLDPRKPTDTERIAALEQTVNELMATMPQLLASVDYLLHMAKRQAAVERALKTAQSFDELESKLREG